jgi:hypothetical protein
MWVIRSGLASFYSIPILFPIILILKLWTSLLFFIPALIALYFHLYIYAAVILLTMMSSVLYHLAHEKILYWLDVLVSILLMVFNLAALLPLKLFSFTWSVVLVAVLVSIYFWYRAHKGNYDLYHSLWHIVSVIITLICILGYKIAYGY